MCLKNIWYVFIHIWQREEAEANRWKDVMAGDLGEWGKAEEKKDSDKSELSQLVNIDGVHML